MDQLNRSLFNLMLLGSLSYLSGCADVSFIGTANPSSSPEPTAISSIPTPSPRPGEIDDTLHPCPEDVKASAGIDESCEVRTYPNQHEDATFAFEDGYDGDPDNDFNDFLMSVKLHEVYLDGRLAKIIAEMSPVARLAGYKHKMILVADGTKDLPSTTNVQTSAIFPGDAAVKVEKLAPSGELLEEKSYSKSDDIVIFEDTSLALNRTTESDGSHRWSPKYKVRVSFDLNSREVRSEDRPQVPVFLYRFMMHTIDTGLDIDLGEVIFKQVKPSSLDPVYGVVVPTQWRFPIREVPALHVKTVYPYFEAFRLWLEGGQVDPVDDKVKFWFNYPADDADALLYHY